MKPELNKPSSSSSFLNIAGKTTLFILIVIIGYFLRGIKISEQFIFITDTLPEGSFSFQLQNRVLLMLFLIIVFFILGKKYNYLFSVSPLKKKVTYFWIFGVMALVILLMHQPLSFHLLPLQFDEYIQFLIIVCIIVPFEEEFFYRGMLLLIPYRKLQYVMLIISSLMFALIHSAVFSTLLLGLALGTLAIRFRNLWVPILAHSLWNAFSMFF
ncbi:CAAX prenyl protease-like protein [Cytobacillus firmus]|uniref:CAAX prenyl protease-like protein n=2 Tax=Cytobacillus TaxID=2675230 RepID=A0A366JK55_CYTFI|nr:MULTISPECIES: CPBP family intramembrane glutamic endopeptidase [Cytobacillus]RBP87624.1 CAAX prenyl protease-like protein [Cytobacillus firmus]TDX39450.1 CAAX prenyl protease-like protein [Cytobacillus oceanisediminis]